MKVSAKDIIEHCKENHLGVISDDKKAELNKKNHPNNLCKKCGSTGNELFAMYKKCSDCNGRGYLIN